MVKIVVFDTETTGLPPPSPSHQTWKSKQELNAELLDPDNYEGAWLRGRPSLLANWPHILQLSYVVVELPAAPLQGSPVVRVVDTYIDVPDDVVISEGSLAIHHISREVLQKAPNCVSIGEALAGLVEEVEDADVVVGHNVGFDRRMVVAELLRLGDCALANTGLPLFLNDQQFDCTMEKTTDLCQLSMCVNYVDRRTGASRSFWKRKAPKLAEAYRHFFGHVPLESSLHNALTDVLACLRVYLRVVGLPDVCAEHPELKERLRAMTPADQWSVVFASSKDATSTKDTSTKDTSTKDTSTKEDAPVALRRSRRIANRNLRPIEWSY
jgi:DNA polymerase III epsilon subunit-like protein